VTHYKEKMANHPSVEMVHISLDFNQKAALAWAVKESFPWPTVLMEKIRDAGLATLTPQEAPGYKLVTETGQLVAEGKEAVLKKAAALALTKKKG